MRRKFTPTTAFLLPLILAASLDEKPTYRRRESEPDDSDESDLRTDKTREIVENIKEKTLDALAKDPRDRASQRASKKARRRSKGKRGW